MKNRIALRLVILALLFISSFAFPQNKMTYGVKGGIGFWKFMSLNNKSNSQDITNYPRYSYPPGFSIGLFIENKFSEHYSLVNELLYQSRNLQITIYTPVEDILEQKVTSQSINLPVLLKYKTPKLWDTYFYLGPCFTYLVKVNYSYYDPAYSSSKRNVTITNHLPVINTSVEFGVGKNIKLLNSDFMMELRGQIGITRFHYENISEYYEIGNWRNGGLIFLVGYQL